MRLFELITFTLRVRTTADALARLEETLAVGSAGWTLMGCWASEIGPLNQVIVLTPPSALRARRYRQAIRNS